MAAGSVRPDAAPSSGFGESDLGRMPNSQNRRPFSDQSRNPPPARNPGEAAQNRGYNKEQKYGDFYELLTTLVSKGLYSTSLVENYTKNEIDQIGSFLNPDNDYLFTYIGLRTLADRYLTKDFSKQVYELPQERFLVIAMTLMARENKENRLAQNKPIRLEFGHVLPVRANEQLPG